MAAAPYTMDSVDRIRIAARSGKGAATIGAMLDWPADRVERIAARHQIELVTPLTSAPPPAEPPTPLTPTQEAPLRRKRGRYGKTLKDHPRCEYITVAISPSARDALGKISVARGKSLSGTAAIALDYALRHGLFPDLVDTAIEELEGAES